MKKKIIFGVVVMLITITTVGCAKKERTMEYLLDRYVEAYTKASIDAVQDMFPPFYIEYSKDYLTKEKLEKNIKEAKETYGDDYTITYKIGDSTKLTDEELDKLNQNMASTYKSKDNAKECHKYKVSMMFKGSKKEDPINYSTIGYCNYDGTWYIVRIN